MARIAAIQMTSSTSVTENLQQVAFYCAKAQDEAVDLLVLPENFAWMGKKEANKLAVAENYGQGEIQEYIGRLAKRHRLWLIAGTIPLKGSNNRVKASSLVYDDKGQCVARYDKIHLFDVCITRNKGHFLSSQEKKTNYTASRKEKAAEVSKVSKLETYLESQTVERGNDLVVVATPVGKIGLSVCYDLRFPELYQQLIIRGAEILAVPSAFTAITGRAHWEVLLRARAIENLCYVVAPNQSGQHENGRQTYGHTMIVWPWGKIMVQQKKGVGMISADINLEELAEMRRQFPCNDHHVL